MGLRLFFLPNFPAATFIQGATFIPDSRVHKHYTPPNSEIICGQNVGTKVVCGIIFFFEKKAMMKI